jgi:hypothetical protein
VDAFQIIDAVSASFFALLGIWAAVDRRHWFIRFSVVTGVLLIALFLPAYEVVIEFAIEMVLIVAAVAIARRKFIRTPRLSLETALLCMVVVAIAAAVLGHSTELRWKWLEMVSVGIRTSIVALWCLWLVCVRTRIAIRLPLAVAMMPVILVVFWCGDALLSGHYVWRSGNDFWPQVMKYASKDTLVWWLKWYVPRLLLGQLIIVSALLAAKASGWFTSAATTQAESKRWPRIAGKFVLCTMMACLAAPLVYLFYRLMTPTPLPVVQPPIPNGYDDLVAAGELAPSWVRLSVNSGPLTKAVMEPNYRALDQVSRRIAAGLTKQCQVYPVELNTHGMSDRHYQALNRAMAAEIIRLRYLLKYGETADVLEEAVRIMRFGQEATRGGSLAADIPDQCEDCGAYCLNERLGQYTRAQCISLIEQLSQFDRTRESFAVKLQRQRVIDENSGWEPHAEGLLRAWSGDDKYAREEPGDRWEQTQTRLLIVNLAGQAFFLDHRRAPRSLAELVPKYLQEIPRDPFTLKPLSFRADGNGYVVYSFGSDRDDDHGRDWSPAPDSWDQDITAYGPHCRAVGEKLFNLGSAAVQTIFKRPKP